MARISTRIWDLGSDERGMIRDAVGSHVSADGPYSTSFLWRCAIIAAFAILRDMILDWQSVEEACESMEHAARQRMQAEPDDTEARAYDYINPIYC